MFHLFIVNLKGDQTAIKKIIFLDDVASFQFLFGGL